MSYLMKLSGLVLAVLGLSLVATAFVFPGWLDVYGLRLDTAAILLVGGILALGLGGVIDALKYKGKSISLNEVKENEGFDVLAATREVAPAIAEEPAPTPVAVPEKKSSGLGGVFSRKSATATAAAAAAAVTVTHQAVADPVADTISALDEAKAEITRSMGNLDGITEPAAYSAPVVDEIAELETEIQAEPLDTDLYVLEEKVIRGRPARILSDETVEAETDEGWMRFENLEHLNEYLDSVEEQV